MDAASAVLSNLAQSLTFSCFSARGVAVRYYGMKIAIVIYVEWSCPLTAIHAAFQNSPADGWEKFFPRELLRVMAVIRIWKYVGRIN